MAVSETLLFLMTFYTVTVLVYTMTSTTINYTTVSTSTTFSSYLEGTTVEDKCICGCSLFSNTTVLEDQISAILKKLYLDATTTSQYRRKLTSAEDPRPSAQSIGYSGILLLGGTFLFFFVSDAMTFVQALTHKKKPPEIEESMEPLNQSES